ncbi:MAG: hypothetical protein MUO76_23410 [Anaerolineaceae bacterium]|nr:hypothetical protein [Anaerolineaceae bacterium]
MDSKNRLQRAINHQEPDRIPFDLGATQLTGMHVTAYRKLVARLGFNDLSIEIGDIIQQLALPHEEVLKKLKVDMRGLKSSSPAAFKLEIIRNGKHDMFTDEWGVRWAKPVQGGLYFDMITHPLEKAQVLSDLDAYKWIDPQDESRYIGLEEKAIDYSEAGLGIVHSSLGAGVSEMHAWLRGYEKYYTDFYLQPDIAEYIMDRVVDIKIDYWKKIFSRIGKYIDVVVEADDLAGQENLLISPKIYRRFIKPRHARLFAAIKDFAPHVKIFFHSCGAVRPLINDLIEVGVDILNPIQKAAAGMNLGELKKEFGKYIVFWGGGVDTQRVFDGDDLELVKADVRENIASLKAGGGFVFSTIHNTQPNVPSENYLAMWDILQENGQY